LFTIGWRRSDFDPTGVILFASNNEGCISLGDQAIDVSALAAADRELVRQFINWIRLMSSSVMEHGRFEAVAGEGRIKVYHQTQTIPRDRF
jgi:hypothetical protein